MASLSQVCIAGVVAVTVSTTLASAEEYKQITKKAEFAKTAIDKKLVANWGWMRAGSDGRVSGVSDGSSISGTWKWKGPYYCRDIRFGDTKTGYGCLSVYVSGDNIVLILDKGKGMQVPMKIR